MSRGELTPRALAALVAIYIIWGSTYLAIRYVIDTIPPLLGAGVRWIIPGVALYAFNVRRSAEPVTAAQWRSAAVIGVALVLGGNGLVSIAEKRVTSGTAALLIATVPLWIALADAVVFRARLTRPALAGILIGFGGTALLVLPGRASGEVDAVGALTVIVAAASWAFGTVYARTADLPQRQLLSSGMQMICGGIALFVVGTIGGEWGRLELAEVSTSSLVALGYLIVFGSVLGYGSYAWLVRNVRLTVVSTYAYVNPLVAVLLGTAIRNEPLTATILVGGLVIVGAVALIVLTGPAARRKEPAPGLAAEEAQVV